MAARENDMVSGLCVLRMWVTRLCALCYNLLTLTVARHSTCLVRAGAMLSPVPCMNSGVLITRLNRVTCDDIADRDIPSLLVVSANRFILHMVIRALSRGNTAQSHVARRMNTLTSPGAVSGYGFGLFLALSCELVFDSGSLTVPILSRSV